MTPYLRDRAAAKALQDALERYDTLLERGSDARAARTLTLRSLPEEFRTAFALATALPSAAEAVPDPNFAAALEARIRSTTLTTRAVHRPQPHLRLALAAAAAILVFTGVLVPALHSLPGDPLYALKTASEDARIFVASGPAEAHVRLALANERYREVEQLVARSRLRETGFGTSAAGVADQNIDPKLAALINSTLQKAEQEVVKAAAIIINQPHDVSGLDQLLAVTRRGQNLAENVAAVVPHSDKPPVLNTLVSLAKIEAQANAARMTTGPVATPAPCATPTPTPKKTPDEPKATPTDEPSPTPTATPAASPTEKPTASPTATPCATPTPAPTTTPGADDNVTTTSEPTATPAPSQTPVAKDTNANNQSQSSSSNPNNAAIPAGSSG